MLYELTMFGRYYGNRIVNRFNYVSTGTPASVLGSFALMSAFGAIPDGSVYPTTAPFYNIMLPLSNQFTVQNIVVRTPLDYAVEDFYERPFVTPYAGGNSGEGLGPTDSLGFRTNRVRLDIDRGTKRFPGLAEASTNGGGILTSAQLAGAEVIAEAMSAILTYDDEGNTVSFAPCVVSKEAYETPSGKTAYKYYDTLAEQMEHVAVGIQWQPYTEVRTQTSRQYGRGE